MKAKSPLTQSKTLDIVGSSTYGRDPKIRANRTFNMIITDDWFTEYGGYKRILSFPEDIGRGIFTSVPGNRLIIVLYNIVYSVTAIGTTQEGQSFYFGTKVGELQTFYGDVFIDENNAGQIGICDQHQVHIYDYINSTFQTATLPEGTVPGYIAYQNGRFVVPDLASSRWYLSAPGNGMSWFWNPDGNPVAGAIQTKPDKAVAAIRMPGKGNLLLVMGRTVTELWSDVGASKFPYQKSTSINIDYGVLSAGTIACSDEVVCWLGINEKSGPVIIACNGGHAETLSTDGINYKLSQLVTPEKSCGFFVKIAGHLCYQLTFYGAQDNFSLIYDFATQKFFDVSDEEMNYHIARRAAFFNNTYFFVSLNDGNLYEMNPDYTTYDYGDNQIKEIPRIRVCSNIRLPDSSRFIVNRLTFTVEQGTDYTYQQESPSYQPRIALSSSRDGGMSFSNETSNPNLTAGNRINRLDFWGLGLVNDYVPQFRFYGRGPWKAMNGLANIYQ